MSISVGLNEADTVRRFIDSDAPGPTVGLVYGRRRIGKSTMLSRVVEERSGFYWEATRSESALQLRRLGDALGDHLGVGRLAFDTWEDALSQLIGLGEGSPVPIVLDEFSYLLEADASIDSIVASVVDRAARQGDSSRTRLILCGSAIGMMQPLTAGQSSLRGRVGMELVMQAADYRSARTFIGDESDLDLAARIYAVIDGVVGYATTMVDYDRPTDRDDFDRWIVDRVLSPAATLHHEATTLLAEDPLLSVNPSIHHSILSAIATGSVTAGSIANSLRRSVPSLDAALKRLVAAGFVTRHTDPVRDRRPLYALGDPFLQFHYAVVEPNSVALRERNPADTWAKRLASVFSSKVLGPTFEEMTRVWIRRHAEESTVGGPIDHVGPTVVPVGGKDRQIDLVVATSDDPSSPASQRDVLAIGEAKAGRTLTIDDLHRLVEIRSAMGPKASHAKLVMVSPSLSDGLRREADSRHDVELVDLERLYEGS